MSMHAAYLDCKAGSYREMRVQAYGGDSLKTISATRSLLERASGAKIMMQNDKRSVTFTMSGPVSARQACCVYTYFRSTLPKAADHFQYSLLDANLAKKLIVPQQYAVHEVRDVLFRNSEVFDAAKRFGVLVDFTFLDEKQRCIQFLSTKPGARDGLCGWIRGAVERAVTPVASALKTNPVPLSELLAQRTIAALVDTYGITATIATKAVHGLSDKGDVEAAVDACHANSSTTREEAGAKRRPPPVPSTSNEIDTRSEASVMSSSATAIHVVSPPPSNRASPPPLPWSSAFPPLPAAANPKPMAASKAAAMPRPQEETATQNEFTAENECVVCMDAARVCAFIPCGHQCACERCAQSVQENMGHCPLCSAPTSGAVKIFY